MLLNDIISSMFPNTCLCCHKRLLPGERHVCLRCVAAMPRPMLQGDHHDNSLARRFWATFPIEGAATAFCYTPQDTVHSIIFRMKYWKPDADLCRYAGQLIAAEDLPSRILADGDLLLPVPITAARRKMRGFNQSEEICRGICEATGLPMVTDALLRHESAKSQATTARHQRMDNVGGFIAGDLTRLEHRHVVIVDDIITTGATVMECLHMLKDVPGIRISIVAFGLTQR